MSTLVSDTSSQALEEARSTLDESAWLALCKAAAAEALRRSSTSHSWYVHLFSSEIDEQIDQLPEIQRAQALQIARQAGDYATPAERQEEQDWNAENGYCMHGIELSCCPAGCGSDFRDAHPHRSLRAGHPRLGHDT